MRSTAFRFVLFLTLFLSVLSTKTFAQQTLNVVTTAVPFLRISPDARAGSMGELSLATDPDASSSYFNLGKVPFNTSAGGVNVTYTPWLKKLVNDVYLASLAGYYKLDDMQSISASFRYFSLGSIQLTDAFGNNLNSVNPKEYGVDLGYSRKLSDRFGLGVGLKYIYSNLAQGVSGYKAGSSVAGDIGLYYNGHNEAGQGWSFGGALSNLGAKIGYSNNANEKDFIPANLGLGTTYTRVFDESNKISFGVDINKLLVPTPPQFKNDPPTAEDTARLNDYRTKSVISSWFSSFSDAPGGFSEELKEFTVSTGFEYMYNNQFALRGGYFYENKYKGNRQYFTTGVGIKYNVFELNFSYLVPSGSGVSQNPLSNTLRFSLVFNFDNTDNTTSAQ
ncbi:MAG TPA: type IX secretion system outer membrane channel protein PorV [Flavisolibacter sp.]